MRFFQSKKRSVMATIISAGFLVLFIVGFIVANAYASVINLYLNTETQKVIEDEDAEALYKTAYDTDEELVADARNLCEEVEGEGAVLLLNRDNTLPLEAGTKFSCFSQSSVNPVYIGTGSGSVQSDNAVSLSAALRDVFGEDCVNTDLWKFYVTSGHKRANASTSGGSQEDYRLDEVPWEAYTDAVKDTFVGYGDVALVMLSRSGGEGADLPSHNENLAEYLTDGDYLKLCKEEKELLQNLKEYKQNGIFKKVIVILNFANALQLDFLEEYDIDAVLWAGDMGMTGMNAVAKILNGQIVPSGRLVDTFLRENHSSPAMVNYGATPYTNWQEYDLGEAQNNSDVGIEKCNKNYVVYQEGIYVGYRYYETRYEDACLGRGNAGDFSYNEEVAFPFGYGLSYTDFQYSNFFVDEKEDSFEITVDVTNEGDVDAKHTVQVYFQPPYTAYDIENGVEKAAVELCGYDKQMVEAGRTVTYTILVEKEDLTSYDANLAKTYVLEDGDYYFTVGENAHHAVNNILLAKAEDGVDVDEGKMSGTGDAALAVKWTNETFDDTTYAKSSVTGQEITNQFDHADLNQCEGTSEQENYVFEQKRLGGNVSAKDGGTVCDRADVGGRPDA